MGTETLEAVDVLVQDDSHLSHMVNCPDDCESTEMWLFQARMNGLTVTALCGYQWVPSRDPLRHPICQPCIDTANIIIAEVNA